MRLIDADYLMCDIGCVNAVKYGNETPEQQHASYSTLMMYEIADYINDAETVDAVEVVRCKECVYWKLRHIKLNDGSERAYFPGESYVDITVGINVGSQCMVDEYSGYGCDKSVFRRENDFCSRGKRKIDAEVHDVPQD